mmetsp:Transcript_865/g.1841  ORF Transcript_865/g.1841 Transcript_865/m.1841 type:complete len:95 (-) Transcript_865:177-461(-)
MVQQLVFIVGGETEINGKRKSMRLGNVIDLQQNETRVVRPIAPMKAPRAALDCASCGGSVYCVAGIGKEGRSPLATVEILQVHDQPCMADRSKW